MEMDKPSGEDGVILARHGVFYPSRRLVYVETRRVEVGLRVVYRTVVTGDVEDLVRVGTHGSGGCETLPPVLTPTYSFGEEMAREQHVVTLGNVLKYVMAYERDALLEESAYDDVSGA